MNPTVIYGGIVILVLFALALTPLTSLITTTLTSNIGVGNITSHPNTTGGITGIGINIYAIAVVIFLFLGGILMLGGRGE